MSIRTFRLLGSLAATFGRLRLTLLSRSAAPPKASGGHRKKNKSDGRTGKRQLRKAYQHVVWQLRLWDSGRWDGWAMVLGLAFPNWLPICLCTFGKHHSLWFLLSLWRVAFRQKSKSMISPLLQTINSRAIWFEIASNSQCRWIVTSHHKLNKPSKIDQTVFKSWVF